MKPISKEDVLTQLQWRYATKKFDPTRKIPADEWDVLEKSLILTPSSFGLEPWNFFIVNNPEIRAQLSAACLNQPQITDASHLVIFAVKRDVNLSDVEALVERTAKIRNISPASLEGFKSMVSRFINDSSHMILEEWATRQVYIALGQFITTAALLGIDTCPMEGFIPDKVDELLNLKNSGYGAVVLCTAGYRRKDDKHAHLPKVRHKRENVITHI